jgi:hypothetical protein
MTAMSAPTAANQFLEHLARDGISIVTRFDDGTVAAHLTIQLDGDAINRVSPRFLRDRAVQDRHATAVADFLAQWRRLRWLTGRALMAATIATFGSLLATHPSWQLLGVSGVAPFAIRWAGKLASSKLGAALLRRAVR